MPIDPDYDPEIVLGRIKRFFGDGGLCHRFETISDPLIEFAALANWLVSTGLDRGAIVERFRFSVTHDVAFWQYDSRRRIKRLLNLDSYGSAPRGKYHLRPRSLEAETVPDLMRARASVWVEWLKRENLPVPIGLTSTSSSAVESTLKDQPDKKRPISKRELKEYLEGIKKQR
jgi:hypothetical protein